MFPIHCSRLVTVAVFALLTFVVANRSEAMVVLPLEVIGEAGFVKTASVDLGDRGESGRSLYLRINNLSYDGKASVSINGSSWLKLANDSVRVDVLEPGASYGGIGGGFFTHQLIVDAPVGSFLNGLNKIAFRFNFSDGRSIGYRVIDVDVFDDSGKTLLAENSIVDEEPSAWQAPLSDAKDIKAGESLWYTAKLKRMDGSPLIAKCGNCHARKGRDLKYFNYSNHSIVERAKFYGLSEHDGKKIASYIRTLSFDAPVGGRPWNPPYQPGPGTDAKPVFEWAAGAGLNAVVDKDSDTLSSMFGSASQLDIDAATDIRSKFNMREIPLAIQLPDWNRWLPWDFPGDIWGETFFQSEPWQAYSALREQLQKHGADALVADGSLINVFEKLPQRSQRWIGVGNGAPHPWTSSKGDNLDARVAEITAEQAKIGYSKWITVKMWELAQGYELEDRAIDIRPAAEKYQWPNNIFSTVTHAPSFIATKRFEKRFAWQITLVGLYRSSAWYELQLILSPGMRSGSAVAPVDWVYHYDHINLLGKKTGIYEPLRLFKTLIKSYQQRDKPGQIDKGTWNMREVSPWRLYSDYKGDQSTYQWLDSYQPGLRTAVTGSLLKQFLRRSNEYSIEDWQRTAVINTTNYKNWLNEHVPNWYKLEVDSYQPNPVPNVTTDFNLFARDDYNDAVEADAMIRLLPRLIEAGIDPDIVNDLAIWSRQFWPLGNWQPYIIDLDEKNK